MLTQAIDHTTLSPSVSLNTALVSKPQKQEERDSPLLSTPQKLEEHDTITLSARKLLSEEEAQQTLVAVEQQISTQKDEALSVHSGLSLSRVMQLLEGL